MLFGLLTHQLFEHRLVAVIQSNTHSMRSVVNISLPSSFSVVIKKEVRTGKFASTSEFFRSLLRRHLLAKELHKRDRDMDNGKGRVLRSLRSLR